MTKVESHCPYRQISLSTDQNIIQEIAVCMIKLKVLAEYETVKIGMKRQGHELLTKTTDVCKESETSWPHCELLTKTKHAQ